MLLLSGVMFVGCTASNKLTPQQTSLKRTPEYQQQIQQLISRDAENKRWARLMLQEIDTAIQNDDYQSYIFFVREYENIPKEIVPQHLRNEPGYSQPITDLEHYFRIEIFLPAYDEPNPYRPIPVYAE